MLGQGMIAKEGIHKGLKNFLSAVRMLMMINNKSKLVLLKLRMNIQA